MKTSEILAKMSLQAITALHNAIAADKGTKPVKKFESKPVAIKRTLGATLLYAGGYEEVFGEHAAALAKAGVELPAPERSLRVSGKVVSTDRPRKLRPNQKKVLDARARPVDGATRYRITDMGKAWDPADKAHRQRAGSMGQALIDFFWRGGTIAGAEAMMRRIGCKSKTLSIPYRVYGMGYGLHPVRRTDEEQIVYKLVLPAGYEKPLEADPPKLGEPLA